MRTRSLLAAVGLALLAWPGRAADTPGRDPMLDALHAPAASPQLAAKLQTYGRFVGSWTLDVTWHPPGGTPVRTAEGEWHFAWVLDGRAIQDVWIFPARAKRDKPEPWHFYGSTMRWYDPQIDAWHITYFEPTRPFAQRQLGRAVGPDIVQIGEDASGVQRRWRFTEITDRSFHWIGEVSWDKGASWTLELDMRARRAG
jgi:hypothetical protein